MLEVLVGHWTVYNETRLSPDEPGEKSVGSSEIKKTVGSKALEENFTGTIENKPFITKTILAQNNLTKHFQRMFIDSEHGTLVEYEGGFENSQLIFNKEWTYPNKATVKLRVTYKFVSRDEFTIESARMPQGSIKWDITNYDVYKRKIN